MLLIATGGRLKLTINMDIEQYDTQYLPGIHNRIMRYYFYLNQGVNVLNQFRNLFLGIFAAYFALKLDNPWLLIAMFLPSLLILIGVGYYATHYLSKVQEWLSIRFSTHYARRQFDFTRQQYELLVEIRDLLKHEK